MLLLTHGAVRARKRELRLLWLGGNWTCLGCETLAVDYHSLGMCGDYGQGPHVPVVWRMCSKKSVGHRFYCSENCCL